MVSMAFYQRKRGLCPLDHNSNETACFHCPREFRVLKPPEKQNTVPALHVLTCGVCAPVCCTYVCVHVCASVSLRSQLNGGTRPPAILRGRGPQGMPMLTGKGLERLCRQVHICAGPSQASASRQRGEGILQKEKSTWKKSREGG